MESTTGASLGSSGGAIRFRCGTPRGTKAISSPGAYRLCTVSCTVHHLPCLSRLPMYQVYSSVLRTASRFFCFVFFIFSSFFFCPLPFFAFWSPSLLNISFDRLVQWHIRVYTLVSYVFVSVFLVFLVLFSFLYCFFLIAVVIKTLGRLKVRRRRESSGDGGGRVDGYAPRERPRRSRHVVQVR